VSASSAVIIDTDVFSTLYVGRARSDSRASSWRRLLIGRRVVIAFQTRAEVLSGARISGWGERRTGELVRVLDRTPTVLADRDVIDAYATLTADCRRLGHALHKKEHTGDRWIAACAAGKGLELLAGDGIYASAPGVVELR
jgi:predicted nucleic acid-binding protein